MPSQESSGSRKRPRSPREDNEKMDAEDEIMATNITAKVGSTPENRMMDTLFKRVLRQAILNQYPPICDKKFLVK